MDHETEPLLVTISTKRSPKMSKKWSNFGGRAVSPLGFDGNTAGLPGNGNPQVSLKTEVVIKIHVFFEGVVGSQELILTGPAITTTEA